MTSTVDDVHEPVYKHIPLPFRRSIRLVEIFPADSDTPVQCKIIPIDSLDNAPAYEAVSYVWGGSIIDNYLHCGSEGQIMQVTRSCMSVLQRIRHSDVSRLVWVDAICIDQDSVPEKNAQVPMMGQIYHQATRVIIDLGEESNHSDDALDYITNCSETGLHEFQYGLEIREVVNSLYERPWFQRVWVLQEAYMSRDAIVVCGWRWTSWSAFRPFRIWVDSRPMHEIEPLHVPLPFEVPSVLTLGNHQDIVYTARNDLLSLLVKSRNCGATDNHDRIFALLPMLADVRNDDPDLAVDYNKSVVQVYIGVAKWLAENVGPLFLSCVYGTSSLSNLPSWVPDWSQHVLTSWLIGIGNVYSPLFAGGKGTKAVTGVFSDAGNSNLTLRVRGRVMDSIRTCARDIQPRNDSVALWQFLAEHEAYRHSLRAGAAPLPSSPPWAPKTPEKRLHPPVWMIRVGLPFNDPNVHSDNELANLVSSFCVGRMLVSTTRGRLAFVPRDAREGDVIVCFMGVGVPFVLRGTVTRGEVEEEKDEDETEGEQWRIVAEAWVWGLMGGEAWEPKGFGQIRTRDLLIC